MMSKSFPVYRWDESSRQYVIVGYSCTTTITTTSTSAFTVVVPAAEDV